MSESYKILSSIGSVVVVVEPMRRFASLRVGRMTMNALRRSWAAEAINDDHYDDDMMMMMMADKQNVALSALYCIWIFLPFLFYI